MSAVAIAPGSVVEVRDEQWLVTQVASVGSDELLTVQGLSELVRDTTATFYRALDEVSVVDPSQTTVVPDNSAHFTRARLWVEATLNKVPVAQNEHALVTVESALADRLTYQYEAVAKALDPANVRPRLLIADAVGLGKTLEIGMILSELAARGRGDRVLIVTPVHVLEQMQHELWCRFGLPFIRLDSVGIQRVRQEIPATRNPFTYFKKAIISIDTLKSPRYAASLRKVHWDAVVIDESHNLTNRGTQNNALAQTLAPNTEALILASATPHNGRQESFAELLQLLDPAAVSATGEFGAGAVERLIIRRHRHSPTVAAEVGADWAERAEPVNLLLEPTPEEAAVASELADTWLYGNSPYSGGGARGLFPWTLAKAFLSSPAALGESVANRLRRVGRGGDAAQRERDALLRLQSLNERVSAATSGKFQGLVGHLKASGVSGGANGDRVVIFTESIQTSKWLAENLQGVLGLKARNVAYLNGKLLEPTQLELIDEFKRENSHLRVLVSTDVASEGVNLHAQCHQLVHYDIPWSLIRIEQRNGRIDRYGQRHSPVIATLLLRVHHEQFSGDLRVLTRLIERENEAHHVLGDVFSIMGKITVKAEEDEILNVLTHKKEFAEAVPEVPQVPSAASGNDIMAMLLGLHGLSSENGTNTEPTEPNAPAAPRPPTVTVTPRASLFASPVDFLEAALQEAYANPAASVSHNGVEWRRMSEQGIAQLAPPGDLRQRLAHLPQSYLKDRGITQTFKLALTKSTADQQLRRARRGLDGTTWPEAHYLGPHHPVMEWATDKALACFDRGVVPAVRGDVEQPYLLVLGLLLNQRGGVVSKAFMSVGFDYGMRVLDDLGEYWREIGFDNPRAVNPGGLEVSQVEGRMGAAIRAAESYLNQIFVAAEQQARENMQRSERQRAEWVAGFERAATRGTDQPALFGAALTKAQKAVRRIEHEGELARQLLPARKLIRPLLVVMPRATTDSVMTLGKEA
ncbi:DEAD/DEAH box helicase [Micrococcales bacterium 31B]|nr:DEAD/DEAH box helicase [Micrococcales bacterium 31B]